MPADRPQFLTSEAEVSALKGAHPELQYVDAYARQLKELAKIERGEKPHDFIHVYFPWNNTLVKTVGKEDYFTLKTNRNQDLITAEEQKKLRAYKVAVLGMSVGSNIAFVLTQAGISNEIVLADFDALDTTNLNRILAGVHEVGLNKTIVAARRIYEDNPFAEVTLLQDGVNEQNLEELLAAGKIDCIVEEIDDIAFKIHARMIAMKHKVPVVMVTDNGDGVVLHVERYDLGHDLMWGKPHAYYEEKLAAGPMDKEKAGGIIMQDIVGGVHRVDPKMLASVKRTLAGELVSWSQLGSAAILGGVIANYAIKEIALGKGSEKDIRAWISPEQIERGSHAAS